MTIYFSLGANLGPREQTIREALNLMQQHLGPMLACSDYFYSEPWGFDSTNEFCNICASFRIDGKTPKEVLTICQQIETRLGRTERSIDGYHDRTIDIDLLMAFDDAEQSVRIDTPTLRLPHPLMNSRDFVLIPLSEIYQNRKK